LQLLFLAVPACLPDSNDLPRRFLMCFEAYRSARSGELEKFETLVPMGTSRYDTSGRIAVVPRCESRHRVSSKLLAT
jgi:hypothetical protein